MLSRRAIDIHYSLSYMARRYYRKDVALIGCPFSGGQPKDGVETFPELIRQKGLVKNIEYLRRNVTDYGDVQIPKYTRTATRCHGNMLKNPMECGIVSNRVAALVEKGARDGKICVTLGGDHSYATGSLIGHHRARENMCVIWVDAHNDLHTHETTGSGNLHGMCLPFVLKGLPDVTVIPGYEWTKPCLNPRDIVYIGLRDTDPDEYQLANELGISTFSMHDVDRYGIAHVVERAVEAINPKLDRPIHVSFDIDAIDAQFCPGTGTPIPGGLTLREALYIGEYVNKLGLLGALDIVEVNPSLCSSKADIDLTMYTAMSVIEAFFGRHRPGYIR